MNSRWIGLDIGGTKCAVVLAEVNHGIRIEDKIRFDTQTEKGFDQAWSRLCAAVDELLARHRLTAKDVQAIGVSCGGPLDSRRGVILCPPHLPGWVNIPLKAMLEERFGIPAYIQNDANACALVEWKLGAGRGTRNMIFLTMGTGMGGGVIAEGRLLSGYTDMGGEIGHLRLTEDGPVGFGKAGSAEGYVSGEAIGKLAREMTARIRAEGRVPAWERDGHAEEEISARLMADYARRGDADALALFRFVGKMLGRLLGQLVDAFNPEKIVIGSIFVRCEDLLRDSMDEELRREAIPYSYQGVQVVPAQTGEAIGDLASIMTALYAMDVDPMQMGDEQNTAVLAHYERLFARYPALEGCRESVMQAYLLLRDAFARGNKLLVCGNGGSCADSQHIVGELMKGFYLKRPLEGDILRKMEDVLEPLLPGAASLLQDGLPAIALTEHQALNTAVQNDLDPSLAMAQQVIGYGRPGDVILGISTSGNAKNVALAVATAKAMGLSAIGLTGGVGGRLKELCDCAVVAPASTPADVQEYHLPIYHTLCAMLEARFFAG